MRVLKGHKYRIYPNKKQEVLLRKTIGCCRFLWNQRVESFNSWNPETNPKPLEPTIKELKEKFNWLSEVPYDALGQKDRDWFETKRQYFNKNRKVKLGKPKFKKKSYSGSFRLSQRGFSIKKDSVSLAKVGKIRFKNKSININDLFNATSITVTLTASGKWYISILSKTLINTEKYVKTNNFIGIDLGLNDLFVSSDGHSLSAPKLFRENQTKLKKSQQHFSRKIKGSKRYEKQRIKVAKHHEKVKNQRSYLNHNISSWLVQNYDLIVFEDLAVKNMVKNKKLSKSIHDVSWSQLVAYTTYKALWNDKIVHKIDRFYPSSKTCSNCGYKMDEMPLDIREWTCPECNSVHHRDHNAAKNILQKGMKDLNISSAEYTDYNRGEAVNPVGCLEQVSSMKRLGT